MRTITASLWAMIMFTGCFSVKTSHEIKPIGTGKEKTADAASKTYKDLVKLCPDIDPAFWRLPVKEQNAIAGLIFSRTRNLHHIQYIKLNRQKGEPFEIEAFLHDNHDMRILLLHKNKKRGWYIAATGYIDYEPPGVFDDGFDLPGTSN